MAVPNPTNSLRIAICVGYRDILFVRKTLRAIRRHLKAGPIYIITGKAYFRFYPGSMREAYELIILDEDLLVPEMNYGRIRETMLDQGLDVRATGWYFLQFLKMGFALTKYAGERHLILDADTLPTEKRSFEENGKLLFAAKTEHHKPYFNTTQRLLGMGKSVDYSFIAEHMIIKTSIMKELIADIEKAPVEGGGWVEKIMNAADRSDPNAFSEFETYGTYVVNKYPGLYKTRVLKTWREAGKTYGRGITEKEILSLNGMYDTISVEKRDVPPFPRSLQHYAVKIVARAVCNTLSFFFKT